MVLGRRQFATWLLASALVAGGVSLLVTRHYCDESHVAEETDFHQWLHDQLRISPQQEAALRPLETTFETERSRLKERIRAVGKELALAVKQGSREVQETEQILERLHAAQGELQRVTLSHFYAMKQHLDDEQVEKLRQWTHDSLIHE